MQEREIQKMYCRALSVVYHVTTGAMPLGGFFSKCINSQKSGCLQTRAWPCACRGEMRPFAGQQTALSFFARSWYTTGTMRIRQMTGGIPLKTKSPLIRAMEDYFYSRGMKRKDAAAFLGLNESVFSQIMNGKRKISATLAKRLYTDLHLNADLILQNI